MHQRVQELLPGMGMALPLPFIVWWLLGATPDFLWQAPLGYLFRISWIILTAVFCTFLVHVVGTLARAREFVDPATGQLDALRALRLREAGESVFLTGLLMFWMTLIMAGATAMAEIYRNGVAVWHDATLWQLEHRIFTWLLAEPPAPAALRALDFLYGQMWTFLLLAVAVLIVRRRHQQALLMATTVLLMFYARLLVAMMWPTRGPAIAYPELFDFLRETGTYVSQQSLAYYQAGAAVQNGLYHGLVAMPSLHVGLTALAAYHLATMWRSSLWLTIPWLLVTWVVTLLLGWHYAVDGIGGIVVALGCHGLAKLMLGAARRRRAPVAA